MIKDYDTEKWPFKGHLPAGIDEHYPDGCRGNCDGVCEGKSRAILANMVLELCADIKARLDKPPFVGPISPCLDPEKMHGAGDQFPGSDY